MQSLVAVEQSQNLIEDQHAIYWVVFSTAEDSLPQGLPKDTLSREFTEVTKAFGLKDNQYEILNYRVRYLHEKRQEILEKIVQVRNSFQPTLVIGPSLNDLHQDHIIVANEMVRAFQILCNNNKLRTALESSYI